MATVTSEQIAAQTAAFLAAGNEVTAVEFGVGKDSGIKVEQDEKGVLRYADAVNKNSWRAHSLFKGGTVLPFRRTKEDMQK